MAIRWTQVTWYSKAIALALFVVVSLGGFWFGLNVGYVKGYLSGFGATRGEQTTTSTATSTTDPYYQNVAEWQTTTNDTGGFSIAYPIDFPTESGAGMTNFRLTNSQQATLYFDLTIPKAFEPQTNFDDARLTASGGKDTYATTHCLVADPNSEGREATSTVMISGIPFTVFHASDAGAGNLYDTTSYRTLRNGQCYAIEYTLHSSQIGNYPSEYGLKPFDKAKLTDVLDRIVGTFKFL